MIFCCTVFYVPLRLFPQFFGFSALFFFPVNDELWNLPREVPCLGLAFGKISGSATLFMILCNTSAQHAHGGKRGERVFGILYLAGRICIVLLAFLSLSSSVGGELREPFGRMTKHRGSPEPLGSKCRTRFRTRTLFFLLVSRSP